MPFIGNEPEVHVSAACSCTTLSSHAISILAHPELYKTCTLFPEGCGRDAVPELRQAEDTRLGVAPLRQRRDGSCAHCTSSSKGG